MLSEILWEEEEEEEEEKRGEGGREGGRRCLRLTELDDKLMDRRTDMKEEQIGQLAAYRMGYLVENGSCQMGS